MRTHQAIPSSKAKEKQTIWWVCGILAGLGAMTAICLAVIGLLFWTETIPLPDFLDMGGGQVSQVLPTALPVIVPEPTQPIPMAESPTPAPAAAEEVTETASDDSAPKVVFEGISLSFDDTLVRNIAGTNIPAVTDTNNAAPWELLPQYVNLEMVGYPLKDTFHEPRIMIFPLDEYFALSPSTREVVENLNKLLGNKEALPGKAIPFLPEWNAAQTFHAAMKFVDFKNGSGVRFLTQYGQDISPVNNNAIFYCYQGVTSDGKYYVSAILPVFDPLLPMDGSEYPGGDYAAFSDQYPEYIKKTIEELNDQQDLIFFPDLKLLDEMMASLEIKL
ncbi:MAG: hypothetical protein AB9891_15590 [Anaerolineaceae bacterium]